MNTLLNRINLAVRLAVVAMALMATPAAFGQKVISFRADDWYPFNTKPDDAKPGFIIEVLKAIYVPKGYTIDYQLMPWKRAIADGERGSFNAIIGAIKSDAPKFVFPDEAAGMSDTTFFVKKGSPWKFSGAESLMGKKLCITSGYSYGDPLDSYIKASPQGIDESSGDTPLEQSIRKLQAGRVDVCVEVAMVFWAQVDRMGLSRDNFADTGMLGTPEPIFVAFSPAKPESKELAKIYSDGVQELRKSGKLGEILSKYGLKDWSK